MTIPRDLMIAAVKDAAREAERNQVSAAYQDGAGANDEREYWSLRVMRLRAAAEALERIDA